MTRRARTGELVAAVEHVAATGADERRMRAQVLDVIQSFIPFDAYAFLLTDPVTSVGSSPLAEVPDVSALPDLIRLKYLTPVNRWTGLPASGCATLQQATSGRPEGSRLWREHLAALGVVDVASVVFTDRFGWWGFLDLWRREGPFDDEELAALVAVRPAITSRLRHAQAAVFRATGMPTRQRGPGALLLSPDLAIRAQTPQTQDWLSELIPSESGRSSIPASAYNVAAQLLATEAGVDAHPAQARVHLGGGSWLTLRADRLGGLEPVEERDIVVTMEASAPTECRDLFSRAHGLTNREAEVLRHLANGHDTRTVARSMSIAELTVQDHLKAVFAKTSTSSRGELLSTSLGK